MQNWMKYKKLTSFCIGSFFQYIIVELLPLDGFMQCLMSAVCNIFNQLHYVDTIMSVQAAQSS